MSRGVCAAGYPLRRRTLAQPATPRKPVGALAAAGRLLAAAIIAGAMLVGAGIAAEPPSPRGIAPGVFVIVGSTGEPTKANAGRIGNQGIIVGARGALVIGTGTREADGDALLELAGRLTDKPVVLAINTHGAPDHVLGNAAFARRGIPILAHRETDRFLDHNCPMCIRNLASALGDTALGELRIVRPDRLVDATAKADLGNRPIQVIHLGWTQQPGSLAIWDPSSGVLFGGGIVSVERIPESQNADIDGWIRALDSLAALRPSSVVPGYGPVSPPERIRELRAYLSDLRDRVESAYARGLTLDETIALPFGATWTQWAMYEPHHRRNVHALYLRIEARDLASSPSRAPGKLP